MKSGPRPNRIFLLIGAVLVSPSPSSAQETVDEVGAVEVHVTDAETGAPLAGVNVRLRQQERVGTTDLAGRVSLGNLRPRPYTLAIDRLGYLPVERAIEVGPGAVTRVEIELRSSPIQVGGLVVTGTGRERAIGEVYRPTASLFGTELQRSLGSSVPASLQGVPGFAVQYNGPGAASPTIRGMSGDRVLMLEDGHRTGDLYQTAGDHGVMVEPLTAQRMEVVRGPAGLLYGSNRTERSSGA
jgi:iron complex outermembrane recepter protein